MLYNVVIGYLIIYNISYVDYKKSCMFFIFMRVYGFDFIVMCFIWGFFGLLEFY